MLTRRWRRLLRLPPGMVKASKRTFWKRIRKTARRVARAEAGSPPSL
jgi:hypothetical protein